MEEEATQPATQQYTDDRRYGQGNSGLSEDDAADIICVLYPMSLNANRTADAIYRSNPKNTLETRSDVHMRERDSGPTEAVNTFDLASEGLTSCGIALRISANLKDPLVGFQFGRNADKCDFPVGAHEPGRRVSNIHFRIYINEHCVIMIEDQSTNGTVVDNTLLKAKEKENNMAYKHTLETGQKIVLTGSHARDDYTFMVWVPNRSDDAELAYQQNVTRFFLQQKAYREEVRTRRGRQNGNPVNLFPTPATTTPDFQPMSNFGTYIREWKGGSKYNRVGQIGKGAFATVYKMTAKLDGTPFAAKELEKRRFMKNGVLDQKVDMEMRIMSRINHANIIKYIEHVDWEDYLYIIMEFVPGGDLGSLVNQHGHLPEPDVKDMASQLLSALGYLHSQGVTHRDVKPDNILISSRSPLQVKLTDFGLSKVVDSEETFLRTFCGTLLYCAPEVYTEYREFDNEGRRTQRKKKPASDAARYGHAVDVWSLAGVLFFALCGSPPYPTSNGATYITLLHRVMTEPLDIRPLQYVNVSEPGIRFIRHMLHVRPEYRATIEELQRSSWLLGGDSMEMSMDEDSSELEQGASQLSLQETDIEQSASQLSLADDHQINDSEEFDQSVSDVTEIRQREIPSSFSDGNSNGASFDYNYINGHRNLANNGNGRLFGEINMSVGSSGAIPMDPQLNLPLPSANNHNQNIHLTSADSAFQYNSIDDSENEFDPSQIDRASQQAGVIPSTEAATTMAPPVQRPPGPNFKPSEFQRRLQQADRASSLMGTESMVGQLNMHSPASAASPGAESPLPETAQEMAATSLRRPREEGIEGEDDWQPADLPAKRRRRSEREIDIPVPPSIFWDPADKSTHHNNYPPMFTSDYKNYKDWAKSKGEAFEQGHKSFDNTMQSFRGSRSRSSSFAEPDRAQTEPAANEVRHLLMKRDERTLGETEIHTPSRASDDDFIPPTARASYATSLRSDVVDLNRRERSPSPILGSDFHPPKRVLAKFISTPDSCITGINIKVTDRITSWGRSHECTVKYPHSGEIRVPKTAFKLMLFETDGGETEVSTEGENQSFYISTKATAGIIVNDFLLDSYNPKDPSGYSRFWGELRHGDIVTVWRDDHQNTQVTRFKFECYFGRSKYPRKEGEKFKLTTSLKFRAELEDACIKQEKLVLKELAKANSDQRKLVETLNNNKENDVEAKDGPSNEVREFTMHSVN